MGDLDLEGMTFLIGKEWARPPKMHDRVPSIDQKYRLIEKYLPEYQQGQSSVLDISCGNGVFLEILRAYGHDVMGIELDHLLYLKSQGVPHIKHDCSLIPYPVADKSFDLVCCIGSISFYGLPCESVLDELFRIARSAVFIVVNTGEYLDHEGPSIASYCPEGWRKTLNSGSVYKWERIIG